MTQALQQAMEYVSKLPDDRQDKIAAIVMAEIEDEERWDELFAKSQDVLGQMADEALEDHLQGRTKPLNL